MSTATETPIPDDERRSPAVRGAEDLPGDIAYGFPEGTPGSGEKVPFEAADLIRDVFLLNDGRISRQQTVNLLGRMSFTYGWKIWQAWDRLFDSGMWERDGDDFVNWIQVSCAKDEARYQAGLSHQTCYVEG